MCRRHKCATSAMGSSVIRCSRHLSRARLTSPPAGDPQTRSGRARKQTCRCDAENVQLSNANRRPFSKKCPAANSSGVAIDRAWFTNHVILLRMNHWAHGQEWKNCAKTGRTNLPPTASPNGNHHVFTWTRRSGEVMRMCSASRFQSRPKNVGTAAV